MTDYIKQTEQALYDYLPDLNCREKELIESMKYSLEAGGKRVRPNLVFSFNKLCNGKTEAAIPFACAVEMIHTYSLIHDDLPCMDNDDMRRGKPSNHKVYGEDIALLAGDALQSLAFEIMTSDKAISQSSAAACCKAVNTLAAYCGARGMVGGQVIDLINENKSAPIEVLREMDYKKTACLIKAACELGCISANADDKLIKSAFSSLASFSPVFVNVTVPVYNVSVAVSDLFVPSFQLTVLFTTVPVTLALYLITTLWLA